MDAKQLGELIYTKRMTIKEGTGRQERVLSLRGLGRLLEIPVSNLSRYERGLTAPSSEHVDKIYGWLGMLDETRKKAVAIEPTAE